MSVDLSDGERRMLGTEIYEQAVRRELPDMTATFLINAAALADQQRYTSLLLEVIDNGFLSDNAEHLSCSEAQAFADWLVAYGRAYSAQELLELHTDTDGECEGHPAVFTDDNPTYTTTKEQ